MKKIFLYLFIFWLFSLVVSGLIIFERDSLDDNYKVNINRIQNRLNENPEMGVEIIADLGVEELGSISEVKIIDYNSSTAAQKTTFFNQAGLEDTLYIFRSISESSFMEYSHNAWISMGYPSRGVPAG